MSYTTTDSFCMVLPFSSGYTDIFELLAGYVDLGTAGQCPSGDGEVFGLVFCSHFYLFMRFYCFYYLYDYGDK
mgnify:CR=1 FL=1